MQSLTQQRKKIRSFVLSSKIDPAKTIKAEAKCLIWPMKLEDTTQAIVKMYYRRGIVNFIRGKILNFRSQREYKMLSRLNRNGISCSIPLFWTSGYCKKYGFYETLCTRQISGTKSMTDFLTPNRAIKEDIDLASLFQMIHMMHKCGVYHGSLSTKNILISAGDKGTPKYYLIDLARGWLFPGSIIGTKIAWYDILKIVRSIENDLGIGYCMPYLPRYGFEKNAIQKFYKDAKPHRSFSRKQKRVKNTLKVKIFLLALTTKLTMMMSRSGSF